MGYGGIIGQTGVSGEYLPLSGGTLTGNLDMSNHGIQNVSSISSSNSALIVPNNINVNSHRILNLSQPVNNTDAATKAYVDSKASNWVKAATHSQYDEWHLAVEGGTFVKLVANTEIRQEVDNVLETGFTLATQFLALPEKYNTNAVSTIEISPGSTGTFKWASIISASIGSVLILNFIVYNQSESMSSAFLSINKGTILMEYFVLD